jgi:hypothetical protein
MSTGFFTKRRYHSAGNKPEETLDSYLKKQPRWLWLLIGLCFFFGIPGVVGLVFMFYYGEPLKVCVTGLSFCLYPAIICFVFYLQIYRSYKACSLGWFGRWFITRRGIYYRFGKSPPKFVNWTKIYAIQCDDRKRQIVLKTNSVPLIITIWTREKYDCTEFLPFLNQFIETLNLLPIKIEPLLQLQEKEQKKYIAEHFCAVSKNFYLIFCVFLLGLASMTLMTLTVKILQEIIHGIIQEIDIEPEREISWLYVAALFISTLLMFLIWWKIKIYHRQWVENIYRSFLSGEMLEEVYASTKFELPPRTITAAARKRLFFGWISIFGWFFIFIGIAVMIGTATQYPFDSDIEISGLIFGVALMLFGWTLNFTKWEMGRKTVRLFECGIAVSGRVSKITPSRTWIKLSDKWGGLTVLVRENPIQRLSPGLCVTVFINPEKPKQLVLFEDRPFGISYDPATNTFDVACKRCD